MLRNYLKIAIRNLIKHKGFSFVNILGLAVGLACCMLIMLFVQDELSYDRYHENSERIYRVAKTNLGNDGESHWAVTASGYATSLLNEFPEIKAAVRFYKRKPLVSYEDKRFNEEKFFFADSSVFEVFSFKLIRGNPKTALAAPFSVVLTEETARKYFGEDDPIGKRITYENQYDFTVTGVMRDLPSNSHFRFDFLASFVSLKEVLAYLLEDTVLYDWIAGMHYTYVLLDDQTSPRELQARFPDYAKKYRGEPEAASFRLFLQPLRDIHLRSNLNGEIEANGDIRYVYIFSALALLILFISCFNFMNLSLARSTTRVKEVGVRKVVGAERWHVMKQFLGEAIIYSQTALLVGFLLVILILPYFGQLAGKTLSLDFSTNWRIILGLIALATIVGLVSASYPALLLARLNPRNILNAISGASAKGSKLRKVLIVTQFVISIAMIISTAVVYKQLLYFSGKSFGFNQEQVLVLPLVPEMQARYEVLKQEILRHPNILMASAASVVPGQRPMSQTCRPEGFPEQESILLPTIIIDDDYLATFGIDLSRGAMSRMILRPISSRP